MTLLDFTIEFQTGTPDLTEDLRTEAEDRLRDLASDHNDLTGAAVAVTEPSQGDSYIYEARVVVYKRPKNLAVVEKDTTVEGALKNALSAMERQVRDEREKRGKPWKRTDIPGTPASSG